MERATPPVVSSMLQQKFLKLLQDMSQCFAGERQLQDKHSARLAAARTTMIDLSREIASPAFDRFMAYLMGMRDVHADYPLQAIRMACLVAKGLEGEKLTP